MVQSCVYGPVPSRRLGQSLGIDLVPHKTCTYDCIYCQLGRTTEKTLSRKRWINIDKVIPDVEQAMLRNPQPDYITLSGSGEPTLHKSIGKLIQQIKNITKIPVAVITNGSLLWLPEVQKDLELADLIIPSIDAGDERMFHYVNRPHHQLTFEKVIAGLIEFRKNFTGKIWLEIFLLGGVTGINTEVEKIASLTNRINPDRIDLNTVIRPPAETFAYPVSRENMVKFSEYFQGETNVISQFTNRTFVNNGSCSESAILDLIKRRPCTIEDLSNGLGYHTNEVLKYIEKLIETNRIIARQTGLDYYYLMKTTEKDT